MISLRDETYLFSAAMQPDMILERFTKDYDIEEIGDYSSEEQYYDTFDWRLYRQKMIFVAEKKRVTMRHFSGKDYGSAEKPQPGRFFWWDINEPVLSDRLKKYTQMRALCPTICLHRTTRKFSIKNRDRKTVVRFVMKSHTAQDGRTTMELPDSLRVLEVRGYEKMYDRFVRTCVASGLQVCEYDSDVLDLAFGVSQRQPLDYGAKFHVELAEDSTTGEAVSKICLNLLDTMELNCPGVRADIDSEFLHDFRIAIRRTRSLLTQLKRVLAIPKIEKIKAEFDWLGRVTGPVRDIDVYLLEQEVYRGLLPESLRGGLDVFFDNLAGQRVQECKLLCNHLSSPRYHAIIREWRSFLSDPDSEVFSGSLKQPCRPLVTRIIRKRFEKLLRDGGRVTDMSPDEQLHRLRIAGKKIRYLVEFFQSFYAAEDIDMVLRHMRKLQNNLGDFNDLSVQQQMINSQLALLRGRNKQTIRLAAALGGLITGLAARKRTVRARFQKTFSRFATEDNRNLLLTTIAGEKKSSSNGGR